PAIAVSPDGSIVTVVFYDQRNDTGAGQFVDLYMTQSLDGGVTWQPNVRVSSVSTDLTLTPFTEGGYMLGDYIAVAEAVDANTPAISIWSDTRTGDPDPFVAQAGIGAIPAPTPTPTPTPTPNASFINGGFESDYAGWNASGNQNIYSSDFTLTTEGVKAVQFNGGQTAPNGILSQTFTTVPRMTYNLSFDLGAFSYQTTAEQRARVTVQGAASLLSQDVSVFGIGTGTAFSHQAFSFIADSTAVTLTFRDISPTSINIDLL